MMVLDIHVDVHNINKQVIYRVIYTVDFFNRIFRVFLVSLNDQS